MYLEFNYEVEINLYDEYLEIEREGKKERELERKKEGRREGERDEERQRQREIVIGMKEGERKEGGKKEGEKEKGRKKGKKRFVYYIFKNLIYDEWYNYFVFDFYWERVVYEFISRDCYIKVILMF